MATSISAEHEFLVLFSTEEIIVFCGSLNTGRSFFWTWTQIRHDKSVTSANFYMLMVLNSVGSVFFSIFSVAHIFLSIYNNTLSMDKLYLEAFIALSGPFFSTNTIWKKNVLMAWKRLVCLLLCTKKNKQIGEWRGSKTLVKYESVNFFIQGEVLKLIWNFVVYKIFQKTSQASIQQVLLVLHVCVNAFPNYCAESELW